jgi:hypothetical protein
MPPELAEFADWQWSDRRAWIAARVEWMRLHLTTAEIAGQMERRRAEIRREVMERLGWREQE